MKHWHFTRPGTFFLLPLFLLTLGYAPKAEAVRVKDLATIKGTRSNQLFGYGLVVGLNGTGGKTNTKFTVQSLVNMLSNLGITVDATEVKVGNVAAVMVTANLPAFARSGNRIDVLVSSLGDAKSLQGGTLLLTPMKGPDQQVYAVAQGALSVGGFSVGDESNVQKNHPTVGSIPAGAIVEKEVPYVFNDMRNLTLSLRSPDFTTALRLAGAINQGIGKGTATALDAGTVQVEIPAQFQSNVVSLAAALEKLDVQPDTIAKVVIDERTGTVVMGENVRISAVAVSHGNLTIRIKTEQDVSQPLPLAPAPPTGAAPATTDQRVVTAPGGTTVVTPRQTTSVEEQEGRLIIVDAGAGLGELVRALNAIGVTPRDLIAILQSIKAAGALQAELQLI